MKTDILFYKLLEADPALLLHLANIDTPPEVQYQFQAIEVKDMAKRTDAVLLPNITSAPLIVAEVQYWRDDTIYHRIVSETARLLLQMPDYKHVQMVVIFPSRTIDPGTGVWEGIQQSGVLRVVFIEDVFPSLLPNAQASAQAQDSTEFSKKFAQEFSPEERSAMQLIRWSITPHDETSDRAMFADFAANVKATRSPTLQRLFQDLFVSLYTSKYKHLSIDEVRAMINTAEIFDDIHESLAYQQYGEEVAAKTKRETKLESIPKLLRLGLSAEQIADSLEVSLEIVEAIQRREA